MCSATLFSFKSNIVQRLEVDLSNLQELPITSENAYQLFKRMLKKGNIKGRSFLLVWDNRLFYIAKNGKDYLTYALIGEESNG